MTISADTLNILSTYSQSSADERKWGLSWYKEAHDFCEGVHDKTRVPLDRVVGVLSALSPRNKWGKNKEDTIHLVLAYLRGGAQAATSLPVSTFNGNKAKAISILGLEDSYTPLSILSGNKVRSFYSNVLELESSSAVTVDTHAYSVYLGSRTVGKSIGSKEYLRVSDAYKSSAELLSIHPIHLQATCWVTYKRAMGI